MRVRAAGADPAASPVEVELPPAPAGWSPEHTRTVAAAAGVNDARACVSLRFADGSSEVLPAGRSGWRTVLAIEPGDVLVVRSGAADGPPPMATPTTIAAPSGGVRGETHTVPLSQEQQNYRRLDALIKVEPAEIRKGLQQVRASVAHGCMILSSHIRALAPYCSSLAISATHMLVPLATVSSLPFDRAPTPMALCIFLHTNIGDACV